MERYVVVSSEAIWPGEQRFFVVDRERSAIVAEFLESDVVLYPEWLGNTCLTPDAELMAGAWAESRAQ